MWTLLRSTETQPLGVLSKASSPAGDTPLLPPEAGASQGSGLSVNPHWPQRAGPDGIKQARPSSQGQRVACGGWGRGRAGSPITRSLRGGVGGGAVSGRLILGRRGGWLLESAGVCHPFSGYLGVSTGHRMGRTQEAGQTRPFPATLVLEPTFQSGWRSKTHSEDESWARQHPCELWAGVGTRWRLRPTSRYRRSPARL